MEVTLASENVHGVVVLVEEGGQTRALTPSDPIAPVARRPDGAAVTVGLAGVPPSVDRLRILAWSTVHTRLLVPVTATVLVDGQPAASVEVAGLPLRAAEILQLYRRHGAWKVRAVASGWESGSDAMAAAIGVPAAALSPLAGGAPATGGAPAQSPPVGPEQLRRLIDQIVGPGPRRGDATTLGFQVGGLDDVSVVVEPLEDLGAVTAVIALGNGQPHGRLAGAALRTSGRAPLGRIAFDGGRVYASASTTVARDAVDNALLKALLSEAWSTAASFTEQAGSAWPGRAIPHALPRELRLGIAEDLAPIASWLEIREMLMAAGFLPLVDAPQACLLPEDGTLWLSPVLLAGMSRAWSVLCERVLRADVEMDSNAWDQLAQLNTVSGPMRIGTVQEVGLDAPWAVVLNFNALQVQLGHPQRDLNIGLSLLDDHTRHAQQMVGNLVDGSTDRNNLPWPVGRRWTGPGADPTQDVLARELDALPDGSPPPDGLLERIRTRRADLDRSGVGYVAHVLLKRAEADGRGSPWLQLCKEVVAMAPVQGPGDPTATASIHVRLARLTSKRSERPSWGPPKGRGAPPPAPSDPAPPKRRRRWFGGGGE